MKFIHIVRDLIRKTILYLELFHHFRKIRVKNHKSQDKFDFKLYHLFPFWRCASWFAEKYKFLRFPFNNLSSIESNHLKFVHKFGDHYFRSGAMLPNLPTRTQDHAYAKHLKFIKQCIGPQYTDQIWIRIYYSRVTPHS
jgi:hypothetical protein